MAKEKLTVHAVILAGGRGTRFWPRSRMRTPKQLLNIVGKGTMLEQTVARLKPLIPAQNIWTVTNSDQVAEVERQIAAASRRCVLTEPVGRNTAAAIALAAIHVRKAAGGDALMAVLPADHHIGQPARFRQIASAALDVARERGRMVVLSIPPTRPETGFGYVQRGHLAIKSGASTAAKVTVYAVRRFVEKPGLQTAKKYVAAGSYQWNAGMFFWRLSTFMEKLARFLPKTHAALETLANDIGTARYQRTLRAVYPQLENISVDYAVLEPATRQKGAPQVFVIPADVSWSDMGSWAAVYELLTSKAGQNVLAAPGYTLDAHGNFLWTRGKFVAAVGVRDLVVVDTPDALLICPRARAQDVGKIVKLLEQRGHKALL
jgi:mannose-1-phosphate guanylyltransferase